ncbi:MAG: acyltransferase family protein [Crocinitomix sp.]|nr:acyltransferase family protein [Crocinitomix sp.]
MTDRTTKKSTSIYFPNLDAARFLAAFAVFMLHFSNELRGLFPSISDSSIFKAFYLFTSKGSLGVNFFFVLSGFLITFLILNERKNTGYFHLGKFLIRRTLRIWPLYFIIGLIGFVIFPLIFSDYFTLHEPFYYFIFMANFDEIWNAGSDSINFLTSPWSVAVEEQFYLFWGIALFGLFKLKAFKLEVLIVVLYAASFVFQSLNWTQELVIYHHTFAVCQDILMGAFIGLSLFKGRNWLQKIKEMPKIAVLITYAIGIMLCLAKNKLFDGQLVILERSTLSLFFAFVILDQIRGNHSFFKFGKVKLFNYLGKISYGIYMYHLVVMYLLLRFIPFHDYSVLASAGIFFILSATLTFMLSDLSYRYIESKFLSLKPKHNSK